MFPTTSGTSKNGNDWEKQEFVFEYFEHPTDRYSDKVLLSVMNDRIQAYALKEGDNVRCGFSHSVREYNGRFFNEIRLYKLDKLGATQPAPEAASSAPQPAPGQLFPPQEMRDDRPPF